MCFKHTNNYDADCLDCIKQKAYEPYLSRYDNADTLSVNDIIDGNLYALKPISVFNKPDGTVLKTVPKGAFVGKVYSYVQKDGSVWWQLNDLKSFVKHTPDSFDLSKLKQSVEAVKVAKQVEIMKKVEDRLASNTNPLYTTGKSLEKGLDSILPDFKSITTILYVVLGIIVISMVYKIIA